MPLLLLRWLLLRLLASGGLKRTVSRILISLKTKGEQAMDNKSFSERTDPNSANGWFAMGQRLVQEGTEWQAEQERKKLEAWERTRHETNEAQDDYARIGVGRSAGLYRVLFGGWLGRFLRKGLEFVCATIFLLAVLALLFGK